MWTESRRERNNNRSRAETEERKKGVQQWKRGPKEVKSGRGSDDLAASTSRSTTMHRGSASNAARTHAHRSSPHALQASTTTILTISASNSKLQRPLQPRSSSRLLPLLCNNDAMNCTSVECGCGCRANSRVVHLVQTRSFAHFFAYATHVVLFRSLPFLASIELGRARGRLWDLA